MPENGNKNLNLAPISIEFLAFHRIIESFCWSFLNWQDKLKFIRRRVKI